MAGTNVEDLGSVRKRLEDAERALSTGRTTEERQRILEERARATATTREEARVESVPVLAFRVGGERYAIGVDAMVQVLDARALHPLPGSPPWLLGAIVSRTRIVPVLDLRELLGIEKGALSDLVRVVIVEHRGDAFGVAAEALEGRLDVPRTGLAPATDGPFEWVSPDRLALLDLGKLASSGARGG